MAEHDDKVNFKSELGISRRDLLRRGAIAGGTLLWAAPVIQSLRTPAYAQTVPACACCCCNNAGAFGANLKCAVDGASVRDCEGLCANYGGVKDYCTGPEGTCATNGTSCFCQTA